MAKTKKDSVQSTTTEVSPGAAFVQLRWKNMTPEQRSEIARELNRAKKRKKAGK